jgi:hypothetical protein
MSDTLVRRLTLAAASLALIAGPAIALADPVRVALDQEATVGGIGVGCTGIGQSKNDPKWAAYPVKLEFADGQRALLANEVVTVSAGGAPLAQIACEGPWVLLKLAAGQSYTIEGRLAEGNAGPRSTTVKPPAHGQATVVLTFPDAH